MTSSLRFGLLAAMDETIELHPTRFWPRFLALFWLAEAALGGGIAALGAAWIGREPAPMVAVLIGGGLFLVYIGLAMGGVVFRIVTCTGPLVVLSPQGLRDVRVLPDLVPWEHILWGLFSDNRGTRAVMFRSTLPIRVRWPMRLLSVLALPLGMPPYTVMGLGTGKTADEIAGLMHLYRNSSY